MMRTLIQTLSAVALTAALCAFPAAAEEIPRLAPQGDALIDEMAPLIELQYQYIEQALGKESLAALSDALEGFIGAQETPVRRVALPPAKTD